MKRKLIRSCTVTLLAGAIGASLTPVYAPALMGSVAGTNIDASTALSTPSLLCDDHPPGRTHTLPKVYGSGVVAQSFAANTKKPVTIDTGKVTNPTSVPASGQWSGLWQKVETMRGAIVMVVSICAEDARKPQDQNVADGLQRAPGVSVNHGGEKPTRVEIRQMTFGRIISSGRQVGALLIMPPLRLRTPNWRPLAGVWGVSKVLDTDRIRAMKPAPLQVMTRRSWPSV